VCFGVLSHTGPPQPKLLAGSQPSPEGKITLRVLSSIQGRLKLGGQRHSNEGVHNGLMCVLHAAVGDTDSLEKQLPRSGILYCQWYCLNSIAITQELCCRMLTARGIWIANGLVVSNKVSYVESGLY
jgi:hypothetical protein